MHFRRQRRSGRMVMVKRAHVMSAFILGRDGGRVPAGAPWLFATRLDMYVVSATIKGILINPTILMPYTPGPLSEDEQIIGPYTEHALHIGVVTSIDQDFSCRKIITVNGHDLHRSYIKAGAAIVIVALIIRYIIKEMYHLSNKLI